MVTDSETIESGFIPGPSIVIEVFAVVRPVWVGYLASTGEFLPFLRLEIEKELLQAVRTLGSNVSPVRRPVR
jgi:hypothetical protein